MIKMIKMININYLLIILCYLFTHISFFQFSGIRNILLILNLIFCLFYYINKKIYITPKIMIITLLMLVLFVVLSLFQTKIPNLSQNLSNSFLNLIFILNVLLIPLIWKENCCVEKMRVYTYILVLIFILIMYLLNFDNFAGINSILNIFSLDERYRISYGFWHPNTLAALSFITIVQTTFFEFNKYFYKMLIRIGNLFLLLLILFTASRTAFICSIVFFILYKGLLLFYKISNKLLKFSAVCFASSSFLFIISYLMQIKLDFFSFIKYANRSHNIFINLPRLFEYKKEILGIGMYNAMNYNKSYNFLPIDNYYFFITIGSGIIGLILLIILIIFLFTNILSLQRIDINRKASIISFFITLLLYSSFENVFFYPTLLFSFISWIIIMTTLNEV